MSTTKITAAPATQVDRSGTITAGNTAQVLMPANPGRVGYYIQNTSDGDLWLNELGTANLRQPSLKIPSGALYESPITGCAAGAISIIGATTSQAFAAREWVI